MGNIKKWKKKPEHFGWKYNKNPNKYSSKAKKQTNQQHRLFNYRYTTHKKHTPTVSNTTRLGYIILDY